MRRLTALSLRQRSVFLLTTILIALAGCSGSPGSRPNWSRTSISPWLTLVIAAVLLVASFGLVPFIGTSFLPGSGEKITSIAVERPAGTSQEATLAQAEAFEQIIRETAPERF